MPNSRNAFIAGFHGVLPMLPAVVPFGLTAGIAALEAGLSPAGAMGMSLFIFAGASQLATAQLIGAGVWPGIIILTAWVINLRMAMYSASLAPYLSRLPKRWKWPLAYMLTDQAYAVSIARFFRDPDYAPKHWFYFGAALPLWVIWLVATALGIWVGAAVPASWQLSFAIPLCFLVLLVPAITSRPSLVAAAVGGTVAVAAHHMPMHLGMITGAFSGIAAGVWAELRMESRRRRPSERAEEHG
ncbi:MAG: AzlC family ABC transporter permease [Ectothiorhodospiraceae bacterium]|jgi:4-azaleucine resistance transporter AzlC